MIITCAHQRVNVYSNVVWYGRYYATTDGVLMRMIIWIFEMSVMNCYCKVLILFLVYVCIVWLSNMVTMMTCFAANKICTFYSVLFLAVIVSSARRRLWDQVSLSVIPSLCEQDYCKSNQLVSLKLDVMLCVFNYILYLLVSWARWDWLLTWLSFSAITLLVESSDRKNVPEVSYNLSVMTLNPTTRFSELGLPVGRTG